MEGLVPRFELDTPRVNSEAPIGLIKKTSTSWTKEGWMDTSVGEDDWDEDAYDAHLDDLDFD